MTSSRYKQIGVGAGITLLILGTAIMALWLYPPWHPTHRLAQRWQAEVSRCDDEQVIPNLQRMAHLGDLGIQHLVHLLTSSRQVVVDGVCDILDEQFLQWQLQPTHRSTPQLLHLAKTLSDVALELDQQQQVWSANLAVKMLAWPANLPTSQRIQLVNHCELILRASGSQDIPRLANTVTENSQWENTKRLPAYKLSGGPNEAMALLDFPGGNLPIDVSNIPSASPPANIRAPATQQEPPRWSQTSDATAPDHMPNITSEPATFDPAIAARLKGHRNSQASATKPPPTGQRLHWGPLQEKTFAEKSAKQNVFETLSDRALTDKLHADRKTHSDMARRTLRQRGFGPEEIRLAELLGAPNPVQRRQLVHELQRSHVNPERWWIWLSEDPDASVRAATVAVLATTANPQLNQQLRKMELEEKSKLVKRQIRQALLRR